MVAAIAPSCRRDFNLQPPSTSEIVNISEYRKLHAPGVIERRFTHGQVARRTASVGTDSRVIAGYAAKFGQRSENFGDSNFAIYEVIEPGFFDRVLYDDVRCLFNHDANKILGRTPNTLSMRQDSVGLYYACEAEPNITYVGDLLLSMERGDVTQSSFAFRIRPGGDRWEEISNREAVRYLVKGGCERLYDVSPVTYPAYPSATSGVVSESTARASSEIARRHAHRRRQLDLAALET
jgi:HK97 family phage prohead protease